MKTILASIMMVLAMMIIGFAAEASAAPGFISVQINVKKLDTNGNYSYVPAAGATVRFQLAEESAYYDVMTNYQGIAIFGGASQSDESAFYTIEVLPTVLRGGSTVRAFTDYVDKGTEVSLTTPKIVVDAKDQSPDVYTSLATINVRTEEDSPYLSNTTITGYVYGASNGKRNRITPVANATVLVDVAFDDGHFNTLYRQSVTTDASGKFTVYNLNPYLDYRLTLEPGFIFTYPSYNDPNYTRVVTSANGDESVVTYILTGILQ